jgi:S-adenosylmethionine-dependent methyltransferase
VPWLNALHPLDGARILEIGCGTGSSIMALTEQGSELTGIDIVPEAIDMTRDKCRLFGLREPTLHLMNAAEVGARFDHASFDFVIFFASLEHMTQSERMTSLRAAWHQLAEGGVLCLVEAPNRLWFFDDHTSGLPFFHWLPDDVALEYWTRSPMYDGDPVFHTASSEALIELCRRGRGVSFHDIELALGPIQNLHFEVDLQSFQIKQNPLRWLHYQQSAKRRYANILRRQRPDLPFGFFMPYLNIAIRKRPA